MFLGKMNLDKIKPGLRVESGFTGNIGTVTKVDTEIIDYDKIGWIRIEWDNGNVSSHPFYDGDYDTQAFDNIKVIGNGKDVE